MSIENYTIDRWEKHLVPLSTGIDLEYYAVGPEDGTRFLMLHGITDGHLSWYQVAPTLAEAGYRCIMPNYRGNGGTSSPDCLPGGYIAEMIAEDMFALIEQEGFCRGKDGKTLPIHLIGHSYGSMISQIMALQHPELIRSVILFASCMDCRSVPLITEMVEGTEDMPGIRYFEDPISEEYVRDWTAMTNEDPEFCEAVFKHTLAMPAVAWKNLFLGLIQFYCPNVADIEAPMLVLWGTNDTMIPAPDQEKLHKALEPKAKRGEVEYVDMPGTGHNGHWDTIRSAEEYTAVIKDFLDRH